MLSEDIFPLTGCLLKGNNNEKEKNLDLYGNSY